MFTGCVEVGSRGGVLSAFVQTIRRAFQKALWFAHSRALLLQNQAKPVIPFAQLGVDEADDLVLLSPDDEDPEPDADLGRRESRPGRGTTVRLTVPD